MPSVTGARNLVERGAPPREPLYLFLHISRSGGQTLRDHLRRHLTLHQDFVHLGGYGRRDAERRGLPPFAERPLDQRQRARVILGLEVTSRTHELVPGREPRYIVFLRDPAARIVSRYNFLMNKQYLSAGKTPISFDEWYGDDCERHSIVRSIVHKFLEQPTRKVPLERCAAMADEALDRFWFVSTTERMDEDAPRIFREIGLEACALERTNVAGARFAKTLEMTPALRKRLGRDYAVDMAFYERWRSRSPSVAVTGQGT